VLLQNLLLGSEPMLPQVTPSSDVGAYQPERGPFTYHDRTERIPWEPMPVALSVTDLLTHDDDHATDGGTADAATIGTIVHDTLEVVLRAGIDTGWDAIAQHASNHPLASREVLGPALAHLERLRGASLWASLGGVTTERTVGAMLDETLLYGRVDALRVDADTAELWDWKTNNVTADTRDTLAEHYTIQMQAYAWILLTTQQTSSVITRLVFTALIGDDPQGAVVEQIYTLHDVDRLRDILTERRRTVASA